MIFERPPLETLAMARDRWTPIYLEHGRLEVDDASVKWISSTGTLCRLPVATISAVLLGPGTTVTHAAIKACANSNTPVCWIGEDGLRFYLPSLGFVHDAGTLPFIYDVADLYKHLTSIPAAFEAIRQDPQDDGDLARKLLKQRVEEEKLLQRMPKDLETLLETPAVDQSAPSSNTPPSAIA